ncbi:MAG: 6,7-dimethyl-8-ribityllumazine synthase, partial [Pseudomonadota bacterium]
MSRSMLIVQAPYYIEIAEELLRGAEAALTEAGARFDKLSVPGALEIPGAIAMAEESERYDGYVALGCVIRGETSHYDIVAGESARGLMALSMEGVAVGNGI